MIPGRPTAAREGPGWIVAKNKTSSGASAPTTPAASQGLCCECLTYHLKSRQLPGCCFPPEAEATFDRSFEHFARLVGQDMV
jgi:hypothetical protein